MGSTTAHLPLLACGVLAAAMQSLIPMWACSPISLECRCLSHSGSHTIACARIGSELHCLCIWLPIAAVVASLTKSPPHPEAYIGHLMDCSSKAASMWCADTTWPTGRFGLPEPSDTASADEGKADTERSKGNNMLRPWWQNKWPPNTPELHTPPFMLVHHELDRQRL